MRDTRRPERHTELDGTVCSQHGKAGGHSACKANKCHGRHNEE